MASLPEGKSWGLGLVPSQGSIEFGGGGRSIIYYCLGVSGGVPLKKRLRI